MGSIKLLVWANSLSAIHRLEVWLPLTVTLCKRYKRIYFSETQLNPEPTPVLYIRFSNLFESSFGFWSFLSTMLWVFSKAIEKNQKKPGSWQQHNLHSNNFHKYWALMPWNIFYQWHTSHAKLLNCYYLQLHVPILSSGPSLNFRCRTELSRELLDWVEF